MGHIGDRLSHRITAYNLVDYLYARLHDPGYRQQYADFLAHDYPRVPYPRDPQRFWRLVDYGLQLRNWHLLKEPKLQHVEVGFHGTGHQLIEKLRFVDGRVWMVYL